MALASLKHLFRGGFSAPLAPAEPFYAIGDVHGRDDLLQGLLAQLDPTVAWVFVGDYIDRGDASAGVLRRLARLEQERANVVCLKGNHEAMMLSFLDEPESQGTRWLRNGGLQTMASFGVGMQTLPGTSAEWSALREQFLATLGAPLLDWVVQRPTIWGSGNVRAVHAAADPDTDADAQSDRVLLWGHRAFGRRARRDGVWIVHGHTIVPDAVAKDGVISIDTGAYATGRLTAALVTRDGVTFQST